ncbi:hypothetical protein [Rheinheimera sp. MMS21-TC3]|uniref:hypothetical protein n=1 Tax=Rheinheimera sp. MMS21-TC3 TaxID=3072790 RepID=UPI0028C4564D|nr:hypothetical protein [Rheinheimera sp. MMS21-TC3]WNO59394.1 hypothetical protein RDV63_00040 [Rheinheimera sp. MMS21-TC3]
MKARSFNTPSVKARRISLLASVIGCAVCSFNTMATEQDTPSSVVKTWQLPASGVSQMVHGGVGLFKPRLHVWLKLVI